MTLPTDRAVWSGLRQSSDLRAMLEAVVGQESGLTARKREFLRMADEILAAVVAPEVEQQILGESCSLSPAAYHVDCLTHLDWSDSLHLPKVAFHLRMLGSLIDPLEPSFLPKVSIVVVVRDGRETIEQTIACAVGQTHRSKEVIVVDDGSIDGTAPFVASLPISVRLIHQERLGLGIARQRGLAEATGDFVQFLDAGDELASSAVEEKLAAWRVMADARVCISECGRPSDELACFTPPAWDDPRSMLGDPMLSATSRTPWNLAGILVPRWYLESFRVIPWGSDGIDSAGLAIRSAAEGVRVAALPKLLAQVRRASSASDGMQLTWAIDRDIASLQLLADRPKFYRYLAPLSARITWMMDKAFDVGVSHERIEEWDQQVSDWEARIGKSETAMEGTTAILLDQILTMLRQKSLSTSDATRPLLRLWQDRQERLLDRIDRVKYVTGSDLRRWLPEVAPRPFDQLSRPERTALKFGLEQLQVSLVLGELPIRFRSLERVAADYPGHPYERYWSSAFRLARLVGDETARQVFRQKLVRHGWAWMGRARQVVASRDS
jgi:glycosyltransferase involved in cell wall biosynthesis